MLLSLLKIPYLRLKYRFLPNEAQTFWAQELFEAQGLGGKLGQLLGQGKNAKLPKSSLSTTDALALFEKNFPGSSLKLKGEVFAASMGQVFFGELQNENVAIKILHPGIKDRVRKEIDNILLLGGYFAKTKGFSFDRSIFKRFLSEVFEEETDLIREAHFQEKFRHDAGDVLVPQVFRKFSNSEVLTQSRIDATLARDLRAIPSFDVFRFFFNALFNHHTLHGDLNDRNWGLNSANQTVIYDFGCSQIISDRRIQGLKKLLLDIDVVQGFQEFGVRLEATSFKGHEQDLRDKLFTTLLSHPISPSFKYSEELQSLIGADVKQLRGHTDPWVLLFMRSLFSLIRVYQERGSEIPLKSLLEPHLTYDEKSMQASKIYIEVKEDNKLVVSFTLPLTSLENLEDLMPDHVAKKIHEENLNLVEMIQKVKDSHFAPQELFKLVSGKRTYRVWLE
jgi:predicted unusual protein kinase regulating ubiquinone biosynthesis (AarF/ABC1/UbiB family)